MERQSALPAREGLTDALRDTLCDGLRAGLCDGLCDGLTPALIDIAHGASTMRSADCLGLEVKP